METSKLCNIMEDLCENPTNRRGMTPPVEPTAPVEPKDIEDSSDITIADGTVDMELSHSMDLSFDLVDHTETSRSSERDEMSSKAVAELEATNRPSNDDSNDDEGEAVASPIDVSTVATSEVDLNGQRVHLDQDEDERPGNKEQTSDFHAKSRSAAIAQTSQKESRKGGTDRETNHDERKVGFTAQAQRGGDVSLPGAFKIYTKLATVRQDKHDERCYNDTNTPPSTVKLEKTVAYPEYGLAKLKLGEISNRATQRGFAPEFSKNCDPRDALSQDCLHTKRPSTTTPKSNRSCIGAQAKNELCELSESSSPLAPFLEELSESIDEMTQSPRSRRSPSRSIRGGSPRETLMHRRVMQKRRRSTAATEPGVVGGCDNTIDNLHSIARSDDENATVSDLLSLPPLGQRRGFDDGGSSVSSFTDLQPDSLNPEQGSEWPEAIMAELVADTALKADERAKVIEETTKALTSTAVPAEVVDLEAMIQQKVREEDSNNNRRRRIRFLSCMVFVAVIFTLVVSLLFAASPSESVAIPIPTKTPTASPAPTSFVEGNPTFQSRDELLDAIDEYVPALYRGTAENSSVAKRYGYPIGSWNVSKVTDFNRLFDVKRQGDMQEAFLAFNEDLGDWDGRDMLMPDQ